jgi:hypothetical protein
MNKLTFGTAVAVVLATASLSPALAGPLLSQSVTDGSEVKEVKKVIGSTEVYGSAEVRHSWNGRTYCWYESGWKGTGWYRCGFAARRGLGWGGPAGWHGWSTTADVPASRRGSGTVSRSTPSVAPLSTTRSSGGILKSPLTNPSSTSSGSLSGSGGVGSSVNSSLSGTAPSTSGSNTSSGSGGSTSGGGSSTGSSSSAGSVGGH